MNIETLDLITKCLIFGMGTIFSLYVVIIGSIESTEKDDNNSNDLFFTLKSINNE